MLHSQGRELSHPQSRIGEGQHHITLFSRSVSQRFHFARGQVPAPSVHHYRRHPPGTLRTVPPAGPDADNSVTQVCTSSKVTFGTGKEPHRGMTSRVRIDAFPARLDADQPGCPCSHAPLANLGYFGQMRKLYA